MSLEVEGKGATCVECGVFDYLPTTCPRCHGVFCRDHADKHHLPSTAMESDTWAATAESAAWCSLLSQPRNAAPPSTEGVGSHVEEAVRCFLCPSTHCVLTPCERCGHNYCASHRFHGHEEDDERGVGSGTSPLRDGAAVRQRRFIPRAVQQGLQRRKAEVPESALARACVPYVKASPLALAPPDYRSRMMELVALLCVSEGSVESGDGLLPTKSWQIALCSLSVAVEAAVGQMLERCLSALRLAGERAAYMDASELQTLCRHSAPYKMEASATPGGAKGTVDLRLRGVPRSSITKEAFLPGEVFVLRVGDDGTASDSGAAPVTLEPFLSHVFFPKNKADVEYSSSFDYVVKDDRMRAAVTRLRLHAGSHTGVETGSAGGSGLAPTEETTNASLLLPVPEGQEATSTVTASTHVTAPSEATASSTKDFAAPWPFHTTPPLANITFHNTKANPLGVKQLTGSGRILVAVFTQDVNLTTASPLPPFVMAVGKDWPVGKVTERIKDEAFALLTNTRDREAAWQQQSAQQRRPFPAFSVHLLGSASAPASKPPGEGAVPLSQQLPPPALLKDGDVLFLGAPEACAPGSALAQEVSRMRALTGKEMNAQKFDLMKKCTVM